MLQRIRFTRIVSMTDQLAAQLQSLHFRDMQPAGAPWQPAVNVYACAGCFEVCMDLAGVNKQDIKVDVTPQRLVVSGQRQVPQRASAQSACCRILAMEIADGAFERILDLPLEVATEQVTARQENGWLWITLPIIQQEVRGV